MKEILKTIIWFLKKPQYIPQIKQVLKRKKNEQKEDTLAEAKQWCKENTISQKKALQLLTDSDKFEEIQDLFPEEILYAKEKMENCPVKMGGEGATSFLYNLVKRTNSERIIETGVAYGWSSLAVLLAIKEKERAKLLSNDMPYIKMNNEDYIGCIIPDTLKNNWILQLLPDVTGIPKAINYFDGEIDLCHYDSDKSYTGRMFAYPLLWKALMKGGLFITDDIQDNIAFKEFCEQLNIKPIIIEHLGKYVGIIRKEN